MTDSFKLAEMQRTSIEFERQRHLANWFIKSSHHMAAPVSTNLSINKGVNKAHKSLNSKNGTISKANQIFYIVSGQKGLTSQQIQSQSPSQQQQQQINQQLNASLALSRSPIFTSQTNLPLQIVTTSHHTQEGHKPKLRRFNSHDTSAMFSVADFENARLARRNEIEMKQRQQQRLKMNSLSSGGDYSTGDSKGSKYSNDSQPEPLTAETFLDRYSLPRVVRISQKQKFTHETMQSTSSNGSSSTNSSTSLTNKNVDSPKDSGELFLLYRYLRERKIYHGYNTKSGSTSRKKGVAIPQEFPGYFSLINEKGTPTATMYTSLVQLVRERVYKFISVDNLQAFTETQSNDTFPPRSHYVKSTARGGQIFRLLAVFEDGKQESSSSNKNSGHSGREKEKGRYAQLLNENRQILYVSLTAKGKFYEIEPGVPQILQKTGLTNETQKILNTDCVHRITNIIKTDTELPINIKFISGPAGATNAIPENLTVTRISNENVLIVCPIEDAESRSPLHLRKLYITSEMILLKCCLGFENEQRMFSNPNVQNILKFCQFNFDNFVKLIEFEALNRPERITSRSRVEGLKILKPLNFPKLLRREKSSIAHEKEDSIIFLSKNDLANFESKDDNISSSRPTRISDKMRVFQPTKKKWFRKSDKHTSSLASLDIDAQAKRMSMERYNDMSKLLQERFGDALAESINDRPISEIGCSDQPKPQIQKSLSLQDVDFIDKPDIVPLNFNENHINGNSNDNLTNSLIPNENLEHNEFNINRKELYQQLQQQSFISEKMYSEFHVKTRQYSKSSSSLHQLLHFAAPQQRSINCDNKKQNPPFLEKSNIIINNNNNNNNSKYKDKTKIVFESKVQPGYREQLSLSSIIDDLPYSSVRDSLLTTEINGEEHNNSESTLTNSSAIIIPAKNYLDRKTIDDDIKENIYAEICHDGGAISRVQISMATKDNSIQNNCLSQYTSLQSQNNSNSTSTDNIYNTLK